MNTEVHSSSVKSFKTVLVEDANISKEETIANDAALHNVQIIRNLPNILRSNNTKTSKNRKLLNKSDTSFTFGTEDGNTSLELNTTSSSGDLDIETNYNKTVSPKLHHQRKQVHNPLDIQYDIPDCNNNKNNNVLQKINQLNTLCDSSSCCEENIPTKKLKYNKKQKKRLLNKKLKKVTAHKSVSRTQMSRKKLDTLAIVPDVNMKSTIVVQNANNFFENDILIQPAYNPNFPDISVNDLNNIATKSVEPSNIFYSNNEVYNIEKKYDVNLNHVISCKSTELNAAHKTIQKDLTSYEFPITENSLAQEPIDRDVGSNFLCGPKILYSCSCANCMSHDKDIIFYEDPVSTSTSSDDTEEGLFTYNLYTNIHDFYIDNYSHIFDDMMGFDKTNLYYEDFGEENNVMKETACTGNNSTTELIESNANISSINQNKSQNLQSCHIDRGQDISVESGLVTYPEGPVRTENVRIFDETDISDYLNLESFSRKENKIISPELIQMANSTDVPVSNSKCQTPENKKGK